MGRKNKRKNRPYEGETFNPRRPGRATVAQAAPRRWFTPIKIGIGLAVIVLGGAWVLRIVMRGDDGMAMSQAVDAGPAPAVASLPPPPPGTRVPLNEVDMFTLKPLTPSSPTINYKGYVIGFCCADSEGYKGGWARLSEQEKDTRVRNLLK